MRKSLYLARILCVCLYVSLLASCTKHDLPWPGPGNKPCKCDAQSISIWYSGDSSAFISGRPYQFFKTYTWEGMLKSLSILVDNPTPVYPVSYVNGGRRGNTVFLLDSIRRDTSFGVTLNSKGQPVETFFSDQFGHSWHKTYTYNNKGQLVAYKDVERNWDYTITYDKYGNVTQYFIDVHYNGSQLMLQLTYDYSRPITDAEYFIDEWFGHFTELAILRRMNLLDQHPHHKLTRAVNNYQYPEYDRSFDNQVINKDGYVTAYRTSLWYADTPVDVQVNWHCPDKQQHPTQNVH